MRNYAFFYLQTAFFMVELFVPKINYEDSIQNLHDSTIRQRS